MTLCVVWVDGMYLSTPIASQTILRGKQGIQSEYGYGISPEYQILSEY